jgi:hypothetical protein
MLRFTVRRHGGAGRCDAISRASGKRYALVPLAMESGFTTLRMSARIYISCCEPDGGTTFSFFAIFRGHPGAEDHRCAKRTTAPSWSVLERLGMVTRDHLGPRILDGPTLHLWQPNRRCTRSRGAPRTRARAFGIVRPARAEKARAGQGVLKNGTAVAVAVVCERGDIACTTPPAGHVEPFKRA